MDRPPRCTSGGGSRGFEVLLSVLTAGSLLYMLIIQVANCYANIRQDLAPYATYIIWANWIGLIVGVVAGLWLIGKYHV
jgi:hypothetical protein